MTDHDETDLLACHVGNEAGVCLALAYDEHHADIDVVGGTVNDRAAFIAWLEEDSGWRTGRVVTTSFAELQALRMDDALPAWFVEYMGERYSDEIEAEVCAAIAADRDPEGCYDG